MSRYYQGYTDDGDAICSPSPSGEWWFHCEHEPDDGLGPHFAAVMARLGARVDCSDCGTGYVIWEHAGKVRAKAVVVRVG